MSTASELAIESERTARICTGVERLLAASATDSGTRKLAVDLQWALERLTIARRELAETEHMLSPRPDFTRDPPAGPIGDPVEQLNMALDGCDPEAFGGSDYP